MSDTITPRQSYILNIINQSEGLLREEIQGKVAELYPISKPTLIRDLNILLSAKLIKIVGRAKATRYLSIADNPLLRYFDLEQYFALDPDKRADVKKGFDESVFKFLHNLLLPNELADLQKSKFSFQQKTSHLEPDILQRELERFVIELSWKSSKIEGNTYTLLETESLIKEQEEARGKTKDEAIMILNHKLAFDTILKNKNDFQVISTSVINQLHNILVKDLSISTGIRKQAVGITGTLYRPPDNEFQIKEAFERIVKVINLTQDPFEKALIAHFMIPYLQPYSDGNKRTGRMLTNAILLAWDLYPLSYRSVDEEEFKKALILFYEQLSIVHVKRLFVEQVKFANETYFK
ncbi:Fic family protein [Candidatus Daviesbacteria bacterium]|nr:Fic family protein [Candidatus Daviesbacteria bacterium]